MRALITGASGFAGTWLCRACAAAGDEVLAVSRRGSVPDGSGRGVAVDLRSGEDVAAAIAHFRPDVVYHLAALTSVGRSWERPGQTLSDNALSAVGVLEGVRREAPAARVVWVSSCGVYGAGVVLPIPEDADLRPANPYAVSKVAGEQLARLYADTYGIELVVARPFSHSGPGQRPIFLLSNLARQAAEGRRSGVSRLRIVTGRADTRRDFTDVRDVVRAYRLLATAPAGAVAGTCFNVSSGASVSAADQVALLADLVAPIEVEHAVEAALVRAHEVMDLRGDPTRLTAATGWRPTIPLRQTMLDTIAWWERELTAAPL